jgi:hypothetical protein
MGRREREERRGEERRREERREGGDGSVRSGKV